MFGNGKVELNNVQCKTKDFPYTFPVVFLSVNMPHKNNTKPYYNNIY